MNGVAIAAFALLLGWCVVYALLRALFWWDTRKRERLWAAEARARVAKFDAFYESQTAWLNKHLASLPPQDGGR